MKTSEPKLSICICTNPFRAREFERLCEALAPQVDKHKGAVEVLVFWNNFEYSLGYLRQKMLEDARGEYICHIDDDDMVPDDYCDTIVPLLDGVDYIGFQVDFYDRGKKMKPVYHDLNYASWYEDERGYYRGVTHLNPTRTEIARQSEFPLRYTVGEDAHWAAGVPAKTQHVIDRPMYYYWHNGKESVAYKSDPHDTPKRPTLKSKYFRFHKESTK